MFGISFEHLLIIGVVLLLFGPKRLPDLGRSLGQSIKNFKDAFNGLDHDKKSSDSVAKLEENSESTPDKTERKS